MKGKVTKPERILAREAVEMHKVNEKWESLWDLSDPENEVRDLSDPENEVKAIENHLKKISGTLKLKTDNSKMST